ncbi:MAG: FAD-dependent oxidoreductase [Bacteroidales bacterium]
MNRPLLLLFSLTLAVMGCHREILLECESFDHTGGWLIDPQFSLEMGSPYLLAHGLGRPVEDARTGFEVEAAGTYHLWARTKDWTSGRRGDEFSRFRILIDEVPTDRIPWFSEGWGWHYAGKVDLDKGEHEIVLRDSLGMDARCDAIYLSNRYREPGNEARFLEPFRRALLQESEHPDSVVRADLVVVGGGIAGCAAALAAAEKGLQVALVHDRPVVGGNASSEVRVHTLGVYGHFERILRQLDTEHYPNGSPEAFSDQEKRQRNMENAPGVTLYLNFRAYATVNGEGSLKAVDARHTASGQRIRFEAPLFADCTGDGWIGYWAGAECMYGREASGTYGEGWEEQGDLWSPAEADKSVMGASLLWRSQETEEASPFPEVPWAGDVAGDFPAREGSWQWEWISDELHQADQAEQIRDRLFMAIYASFANEKKKPDNEKLALEWVGHILGKRESRRIKGDYVYTFNDVREHRSFPDSVVVEERAVDVHYRQKDKDPARPEFLSEALYFEAGRYTIPYRSLYAADVSNLFMAGRCFSCSHLGLGGPRVMRTTGQMGAAVGYAAALCRTHDCSPRAIYEDHLSEYMALVLGADAQAGSPAME